jgi:uncharacterized protein YdeI (YjbR/CyaY-like superfamily)
MTPKEYLTFTGQAQWHAWLEANHATSRTVWLVFYRSNTDPSSLDYEGAVEEALCYGWIDSIIKHLDNERYARKFTKRLNPKKWSPTSLDRLKMLIENGRMTPAGLAVIDPGVLSGSIQPSTRVHQELDFPQEYDLKLKANDAAYIFFNSLPPSQRRLTVGWVMSAVKPETRNKRMEEVLSRMASGKRLGLK